MSAKNDEITMSTFNLTAVSTSYASVFSHKLLAATCSNTDCYRRACSQPSNIQKANLKDIFKENKYYFLFGVKIKSSSLTRTVKKNVHSSLKRFF